MPARLLFVLERACELVYGGVPSGFVFVPSAKDICSHQSLSPYLSAHFGQLETRRPQVSGICFFVHLLFDLRAIVDMPILQNVSEEAYRRRSIWPPVGIDAALGQWQQG